MFLAFYVRAIFIPYDIFQPENQTSVTMLYFLNTPECIFFVDNAKHSPVFLSLSCYTQ